MLTIRNYFSPVAAVLCKERVRDLESERGGERERQESNKHVKVGLYAIFSLMFSYL